MQSNPPEQEPLQMSDATQQSAPDTVGQASGQGGNPVPQSVDTAGNAGTAGTAALKVVNMPWRLWFALVAFIPVADVCLFGVWGWGAGLVVAFVWLSLLAVFVSRAEGNVAVGIAILLPSLAARLIEPGFANTICLLAGLSILAWSPRRSALAWGLLESVWRSLHSLSLFTRYNALGISELSRRNALHTFGQRLRVAGGKTGKAVRIVFPALVISLFFLLLLTLGNVALGKWTGTGARWAAEGLGDLFEWFFGLFRFDTKRIGFWLLAFIVAVFLLMPAQSHELADRREGALWQRRPADGETGLRSLQWLLVLAGVNLVFLLTNTLDAIYLWVRQSPPEGVATTDYLYGGVYGLVFVTLLAGGLLAILFNRQGGYRYRRALRWLGVLWIAQNVFLIGGVGFRLWLHVERFCLTPRRVELAFFLLLVLAGFVLLLIYVLRDKSLRWLIGSNLLALLVLFFSVQFVDINGMCVQSAREKRKVNSELEIDGGFLLSVGLSGWPLVHELAAEGDEKAKQTWRLFKKKLPKTPVPLKWQGYSARHHAQVLALCQSAGVPAQDIANAWERSIWEVY